MKRETSGISRRRLVAGLASAALLAGVAGRTWWVNARAWPATEVVGHEMGEWAELKGAFQENRMSEDTDGYALRVTAAERLSYNEYVSRYATDGSTPKDGLDTVSLACLTLGIRNEGESKGGLFLATMYLLPSRKNEFFVLDTDLLLASETKLREGNQSLGQKVSIRSGTEYEIHLAYRRQGGRVELNGEKVPEAYLMSMPDTSFELHLTNLPVRNVIYVTA